MRKAPFMPPNSIGWLAWLFLVYYGVSLFATLTSDFSLMKKWAVLPVSVAFLWMYFRNYHFYEPYRPRAAIINISLMTALGFAIVQSHPMLSFSILVYANFAAGGALRFRPGLIMMGVNIGLLLLVAYVLPLPNWFWIQASIISIVGGVSTLFFCDHERQKNALLKSREEVEHLSKVAERERIARDLHDVLGHTLSLIALKAELARKTLDRDASLALAQIRDIENVSREALADIRAAITGYRSAGLAFELEQARKMLEAAGVAVDIDNALASLPPAQENVIGLALREATTNVVRHAGATACRIELVQDNGAVCVTIEDDGCGGDVKFGQGLKGMQERAASLGGHVDVAPLRPGLRLKMELPL